MAVEPVPGPRSPSGWSRLVFRRFLALSILVMGASVVFTAGCATLQQLAALNSVDFRLDGVSGLRLAGVSLDEVRSFDDISFADAAALTLAVARNDLPMDLTVHLEAENPSDNSVDARLLEMGWTLLLQNRETLSGRLDRPVILPPGEPQAIPILVQLDLLEFFEGSAQDLVELALSLTGQGGAPKDIALRATPVIETPIGPIRYPQPITIMNTTVGVPE